jgi:hypothetical protein
MHLLAQPLDDVRIGRVDDVHHHWSSGRFFLSVVRSHSAAQSDALEQAVTIVEVGHRWAAGYDPPATLASATSGPGTASSAEVYCSLRADVAQSS